MKKVALHVIEKCGGSQVVADMVGVDVSRVYRWTYPKERGGTDGLIPAQHQQTLLREARKRGIPLEPNDFFDIEDKGTP
jgi:hypothetical protein